MLKSLICLLATFTLLAATPASSQTKWLKYEGNPVLDVGPPGAWDATGLASGIYFNRLTAGEFVETNKLILLK